MNTQTAQSGTSSTAASIRLGGQTMPEGRHWRRLLHAFADVMATGGMSLFTQPKDIAYAVTVVRPNTYFTMDLYVAVPGDSENPDDAARALGERVLTRLHTVCAPLGLKIVAVRRVS